MRQLVCDIVNTPVLFVRSSWVQPIINHYIYLRFDVVGPDLTSNWPAVRLWNTDDVNFISVIFLNAGDWRWLRKSVDDSELCFPRGILLGSTQSFIYLFLRATAGTAIARLSHRNSVCPSVRLSHGWIRQKRCKLGSSNLHHRLPQRLQFQDL